VASVEVSVVEVRLRLGHRDVDVFIYNTFEKQIAECHRSPPKLDAVFYVSSFEPIGSK
jgi:hypothetical protein